MYKMKEVCQMTGLTEKAIRIYMDQKLVNPKVEERIHRKAYFFSEEDVERLKDIATLRNAGFGIAEIKQMQESPEMLSLLIEEKKELLESEILQKQAIQDTLKNLTIQEHSDVTKLVDAIEPRSTYAKETPKKKLSRKARWFVLVLLMCILLGWSRLVSGGDASMWIVAASFGLVFGIIALLFSIRYLLYHIKMKKTVSRGSGKITAVVENENIEEFIGERERSMWKDVLAYVTFGLFGEGIWNLLRPDAWHPVISYQTEDGRMHTATTRYGAFQNTWKVGEHVPITWEDGKERLVHVCGENMFRKKAYMYILVGMILLALFGIGCIELFVKEENTGNGVPVEQRLEYPENADRVEIRSFQKAYELNEEEIDVLKQLLSEAEYRGAEKYRLLGTDGVVAICFYQGETEIAKFITNDFYCIYTGTMKYWVYPAPMEFRGVKIGDTEYITECLGKFASKVKERYAVEEIMQSISAQEELEELKNILLVTENFMGANNIEGGYQFFFTEQGFVDYFGREQKENELGKLEVFLQDGKFVNAVVMSYYYTELGDVDVETYRKEW